VTESEATREAELRISKLVPGLMAGMRLAAALTLIADFIESQSRYIKELESK